MLSPPACTGLSRTSLYRRPPSLLGIHAKWAHIGSPGRWNKSRSKREAAASLRQELPAALAASAVVLGQGFRGSWEAYVAAFDAGAGVVRSPRPSCVCVLAVQKGTLSR